jgi:hypothetical protein
LGKIIGYDTIDPAIYTPSPDDDVNDAISGITE